MGEKTNPRLKKLLIDVVEKQLRENNPPITRITFDRLWPLATLRLWQRKKLRLLWSGRYMTQCVMGRLLIWKSTPKNSTCFTDEAKTVPLGKHNLAVPFSFAG